MAIQQSYRYNPEVKQYFLTNNFIGGLNTVDADDVVADIEFRELLNCDLGNQGIIRNRKGFSYLSIFNEMMVNAVDENQDPASFPVGTVRLAKVAKDTNNIVGKLLEFNTLTDFRNSLSATGYELVILFLIENDLYRLKIFKSDIETVETVELKLLYTIAETLPDFNSKVSVNNVEYLDSIYVNAGTGVVFEYNILDDTFAPIVPFKPTPIDIKYTGFNVLADSPLTWIDDQGTTANAIIGMFLTIDNDIPVFEMPSGDFQMNVLQTGTMTLEAGDISFYRISNDEATTDPLNLLVPSTLTVTDMGGYFKVDVKFDSLTNIGRVRIDIYDQTAPEEWSPYTDFYDVAEASNNLEPVEKLDITNMKVLEINNRLVYYGDKTIWFSDLYTFDYIPNLNYVVLPLGTTDEIVKIQYFRGNYIIFTKDEIYKISGSFGGDDFVVGPVNKFIGCVSGNSVKNVGNELVFLSRDGLYKLKSSVFQDNLENVEKIDKTISVDVIISETTDAMLYNEQYILYYNNGEDYDTLRYYYNIDLSKGQHPFVRDVFAVEPEIIVKESGHLFALKDGEWYVYDSGYTDLMPASETVNTDYLYDVKLETAALSLKYPTHQKKFKSIFIKALHGEKIVPLFTTIKVDGYDVLNPYNYTVGRGETGEIQYLETRDPNITLASSGFLGELELGLTPLGEITQGVHKLTFSGKGKNIKVIIEQKLDSSFGIIDIGYLFKLGKVKE